MTTKYDYELAREELAAIVARCGIMMHAEPCARPDYKGDAHAGHYRCTLSKGRRSHVVTYSVGSGILAEWGRKHPRPYPFPGWKASEAPVWPRRSKHDEAVLDRIASVYRPDVADVLSSLMLDTSDWAADMSFREWCATDLASCMEWKNPSDALDTYEEIRATARFLAACFSPSELAELREVCGRL